MKFDHIVTKLGEFGTFQKRVLLLLSPAAMSCGIQIMISVFNVGVPFHRCAVPGFHDDTWELQGAAHSNIVNASIPLDPDLADDGGYSRCQIRFHDNVTAETSLMSCSHYVYDQSTYASSIVTKWDLVCDKGLLRSHCRMIVMAGLLVGSITTGIVADIIGRKKALMAVVALHASSSIAVAWAPSFTVYVIIRFLTGVSISGMFLVLFVLIMELVGPSKRMLVGMVVMIFWSAGVMILGGIAYAVRDWDKLQMIVSFPILLLGGYWWVIPESPRWLLSKNRDVEAENIIRLAARMNEAQLPSKLFDGKNNDDVKETEKLCQAFTSPVLLLRCTILCLNWMVCSLVFYGLSLNSGNLGGSVYVNFQLMAIVEVIAYVLCLLLLNYVGRKLMYITCMMTGGAACLSIILPVLCSRSGMQLWLTIVLALVGKLGASAAFAIIHIYSAELSPTSRRNSLMGFASLFARVGGMISPYIADLDRLVNGRIGRALPLMVFGSVTIGVGLLCLLLPETLNSHLPETVHDAKMFGRKHVRDAPSLEDSEEKVNKDDCNMNQNLLTASQA